MIFNSSLISEHQDYINNLSNKLASSISAQKDKLLFRVLSENNIDIYDLTELSKNGRFIHQEGKNYQIFNYNGRDLLQIFEPEITCEDYKFKVEVRYKELYERRFPDIEQEKQFEQTENL